MTNNNSCTVLQWIIAASELPTSSDFRPAWALQVGSSFQQLMQHDQLHSYLLQLPSDLLSLIMYSMIDAHDDNMQAQKSYILHMLRNRNGHAVCLKTNDMHGAAVHTCVFCCDQPQCYGHELKRRTFTSFAMDLVFNCTAPGTVRRHAYSRSQ